MRLDTPSNTSMNKHTRGNVFAEVILGEAWPAEQR
ncbi:hypothetical protein C8N30_2199 [Sulfitobacter guttiformis]|uniref:Uncharacterized protein n=1 Tax=Sulfitobacter guttiformis TaxID=74349 RepID=A0A420DU00_9RHOB|nr:hypothetical protein C8N30_2199 [Sulfitobacter guttiformis]